MVRRATQEEAVRFELTEAAIVLVRVEDEEIKGRLACTFQPYPILYGLEHSGSEFGLAELCLSMRKQLKTLGYSTVTVPIHSHNMVMYQKLLRLGFAVDQVIVSLTGAI